LRDKIARMADGRRIACLKADRSADTRPLGPGREIDAFVEVDAKRSFPPHHLAGIECRGHERMVMRHLHRDDHQLDAWIRDQILRIVERGNTS
jgi:hypothetical protein